MGDYDYLCNSTLINHQSSADITTEIINYQNNKIPSKPRQEALNLKKKHKIDGYSASQNVESNHNMKVEDTNNIDCKEKNCTKEDCKVFNLVIKQNKSNSRCKKIDRNCANNGNKIVKHVNLINHSLNIEDNNSNKGHSLLYNNANVIDIDNNVHVQKPDTNQNEPSLEDIQNCQNAQTSRSTYHNEEQDDCYSFQNIIQYPNGADIKSTSTQNLRKYNKTEKVKRHACNICDFKCARASYLNIHKRQHTGEKPYACPMCDHRSTTSGHMKIHIRTHTGEKPFQCTICDYRCTNGRNLKIHIRRHTGEKPYACKMCKFRTAKGATLTKHVRIHTGEKPYACSFCDYACISSDRLTMHVRRHTGEKPYSCDMCDYKAISAVYLTNHRRTHTGERPFTCNVCDYKCSTLTNLNKHSKTHVGECLQFLQLDWASEVKKKEC